MRPHRLVWREPANREFECSASSSGLRIFLFTPGHYRLSTELNVVKGFGVGGAFGAFLGGQCAVGVNLLFEPAHRRFCSWPSVRFALGVEGVGPNLADS